MSQDGASVSNGSVRTYVLNDHRIFVEVLSRYLADHQDVAVVGTGIRGPQAYAQVCELQPDVVVVDPGPKLADIAPTLRQLREAAPGAGLIVLTQNYYDEYPEIARQAGAHAFVEKLAAASELLGVLHTVKAQMARSTAAPAPATKAAG